MFHFQYVLQSLINTVFAQCEVQFGGFSEDEEEDSCMMWLEAVLPKELPELFKGEELIRWSQEKLDELNIQVRPMLPLYW